MVLYKVRYDRLKNKKNMVEKIYIIHYKYLEDRKIYLDEKLRDIKIPYEFIINDKESDSINI
jgi:hypothetical protein